MRTGISFYAKAYMVEFAQILSANL